MKKFVAILVCTAICTAPQLSYSWGKTGHRTVGELAERYLTPEALAAVHEIIGSDNHLWELSNWPDSIRSDRDNWSHTFPWHYVSIDDHENIHGEFPRNDKGDILSAMEEMERKIIDKSLSREERWQALAFYIHLVGDVHQPLHVGNRQDRGANDVKVTWFGEPTNLHSVWDSKIIDYWQLSFTELANSIDEKIDLSKRTSAHKSMVEWAAESKKVRAQCYKGTAPNGDKLASLGYRYEYDHGELVRDRLRDAGYRLAARLNALLGK